MSAELFRDGEDSVAVVVHSDAVEVVVCTSGAIGKFRTNKVLLLQVAKWVVWSWVRDWFGLGSYLRDRRARKAVLGDD